VSGLAAAFAALTQAAQTVAPLPAEPPIGGVIWTIVIPAALFIGASVATFLLYKHFSGQGE
jgi:hypothetical protein